MPDGQRGNSSGGEGQQLEPPSLCLQDISITMKDKRSMTRIEVISSSASSHQSKLDPCSQRTEDILTAMGKAALHFKPFSLIMMNGGELVVITIEIQLPSDFAAKGRFETSRSPSHLLLLLNSMKPLGSIVPGSLDAAAEAEVKNSPILSSDYDLISCFKSLPSCKADSHLPPLMHSSAPSELEASSTLGDLGVDLTVMILSKLDAQSLASANLACKFFQALGAATVPDLNLESLYPHQRMALRWMIQKEQDGPSPSHPFIREWHMSPDKIPIYINFTTGCISTDPPEPVQQMKGGLFCDEPGLGKTVTAISLILKTKGRLSQPLPQYEASIEWTTDAQGRKNGFYVEGGITGLSCSIASSSSLAEALSPPILPPPPPDQPLFTEPSTSDKIDHAATAAVTSLIATSMDASIAEESLWVQCDSCTKWRKLPLGSNPLSHDSSWFCHLINISCSDPQEVVDEGDYRASKCLGFYQSSEQQEAVATTGRGAKRKDVHEWSDDNVDHFLKTMMEKLKTLDGSPWTCLSFLAHEADTRKLRNPEGLLFPVGIRMTETGFNYSALLHALSLQTVEEYERCDEFQASGSCSGSSSSRKKSQHTWVLGRGRMSHQSGLEFDQGSFRRALRLLTSFCTGLKNVNSNTTSKTISKRIRELLLTPNADDSSLSLSSPSKIQRRGSLNKPLESYSANSSQEQDKPGAVRSKRGGLGLGSRQEGRRVYLSRATLVVVPAVLTAHWLNQVFRHVTPGALRVLVIGGEGGEEDLLPMDVAWGYDLVLTSFHRLSMEWESDFQSKFGQCSKKKRSQILSHIHWKRVILDEGHQLGASLSLTNKFQSACALKADSRWVMTGTPTPSTQSSDLSHLQPLLAFLHHDPYGMVKTTFDLAVRIPFESKRQEGRSRLMDLLKSCMIRAVKEDLVKLPQLHRKVTLLDFSPKHALSYNELVEIIRRNILLADWADENHVESILNRSAKNAKWARQMMNNVRMSCCIAGAMNTVVKEEDLLDLLCRVSERLGLPSPQDSWDEMHGSSDGPSHGSSTLEQFTRAGPPWLPPHHPLSRIEKGLREGGACDVCLALTPQPLATPCGHLLCLDCAAPCRKHCPVPSCRIPYTMQSVDDPKRKPDNPNPQWPVPEDVIEWQPVYHQAGAVGLDAGSWSDKYQVTQSSKCLHLLKRLQEVGSCPPSPLGQGSSSDPLSMVTNINPFESHRASSSNLDSQAGTRGILKSGSKLRTKSLVFTQFWQHMRLIESHLESKGIGFVVLRSGGMTQHEQQSSIHRFMLDPEIGVLLMDSVGAVGLDLSFVSHIFLMEPIADKSLEDQVISRAYRMGAQRAVHVEVMAMKGTTEEHLIAIGKGAMDGGGENQEGGGVLVVESEDTRADAAVLGQMLASAQSLPSPPPASTSTRARGRRGSRDAQRSLVGGSAPATAQDRSRHQRNQMLLRLRKVNVSALPEWIEDDQTQLNRIDREWNHSWKPNSITHPPPLVDSQPVETDQLVAVDSVVRQIAVTNQARPRVRFQGQV